MKKYILLITLSSLLSSLQAQQVPDLTAIYAYRHILNNPAAMGLDNQHHLYLGAYRKWFGLEDAPQTFLLSSSSPIINESFGIGGTLLFDRAGLINTTNLSLNTTVHLNPASNSRFSIGATVGYNRLDFGIGKVEDPILAEEPALSSLRLGIAANYHHKITPESFFNLQVGLPQFSNTLNFSDLPLGSAQYNLVNELVIQANLKYQLANGSCLRPSIRYHNQLGEGDFSKNQMIDLGFGISFLEDIVDVRLGVRTGQASMIYGGVGYRFGKGSNAHVFLEPGGPLGTSGAVDVEFVFEPKKEEEEEKDICFNRQPCLESKIEDINTYKVFSLKLDENVDQYTITLGFTDRMNIALNYFENDRFLADVAIDKLLEKLVDLYQNDIKANGYDIDRIILRAKVKNELDENTFQVFEEPTILLDYLENGTTQKTINLKPETELNEGLLSAVKLYYLKKEIRKNIPSLGPDKTKINIIHLPNLDDFRVIELILFVK